MYKFHQLAECMQMRTAWRDVGIDLRRYRGDALLHEKPSQKHPPEVMI